LEFFIKERAGGIAFTIIDMHGYCDGVKRVDCRGLAEGVHFARTSGITIL